MAISDRITSIEEHIKQSYRELEGIGIDTTEVDKNLENIPKLIDGYWETLPKVTGEGTSITLDNTKEGKMKINLKGNTSQATNVITYTCLGTETGDYYFVYDSTNYQFTMPTISANDVLAFNTDTLKLYLGSTEITTTTDNTGTLITMNSTPNPDYPQDIHVVSGNNSIKVNTKNLYNATKNEWTYRNVTASADNQYLYFNGVVSQAGSMNFPTIHLEKGTYTISVELVSGSVSSTSSQGVCLFYVFGSIQTGYFGVSDSHKQAYKTFTLNDDGDVYIHGYPRPSDTFQNAKITYQIVKGDTADYDFVPYQSQSYPINLGDIEMCRIVHPTTLEIFEDRIFKATNGDSYYDTLTVEEKELLNTNSWYKHNVIGKKIFTGATSTENWHIVSSTTGHFYCPFSPQATNSNPKISNLYKFESRKSGFANLPNYTFGLEGIGVLHIQDNRLTSLTAIRNELSTNNLILYYPLNVPTYTEITDSTLLSQLEAINGAKSYNPQTNVNQENNDNASILNASALSE